MLTKLMQQANNYMIIPYVFFFAVFIEAINIRLMVPHFFFNESVLSALTILALLNNPSQYSVS